MEKKIILNALYGFFIGLCVMLYIYPYKKVQNIGGGRQIDYVPPFEYIVEVLRASLTIAIVTSIITFIYYRRKK